MTDGVHEDPETEYERMLDRNNMDCSEYGCWKPMRAFVLIRGVEMRYCEEHARQHGTAANTRWLES